MKASFYMVIFLLFIGNPVFSQESTSIDLNTFHAISSNELLHFADELASPRFTGRLSGSPGYLEAAKWCAQKFEEWGIQPANNKSYFQYFKNEYSDVLSLGEVIYENGKSKKILQFPDDFLPGSNSASGKIKAPLVYVGYGITAPELNYDDYKNVDVKGKIIILESGVPYSKNDTTLAKWTPYAYHRYKFKNAVKHGAAGMIYASKIANPNTIHLENFIYAHVDAKIVEQIFSDAGKNYDSIKTQLKNFDAPSFELAENLQISISAKTKYHPNAQSCNVVGIIEGSDPVLKKEAIIIGGHLDGQGKMGDIVFPGALDNASGVANILGAAKALANSEIKPKRSVLFILIGGEECGLYGAKHYCKNPIVGLNKTKLMINLDMVGNGTAFFLTGGETFPEMYKHFETANKLYIHRNMRTSAVSKNYGRPRSDASIFENVGIPTFGLWTQNLVHPVYYHHPLDKTNVLTPEIMEDAAKLLYLGVLGLANE